VGSEDLVQVVEVVGEAGFEVGGLGGQVRTATDEKSEVDSTQVG
jgi:hypothetical protein